MVDILQSYWHGVMQRLQGEVEMMNQLIHHQGVKGTENEGSLARLLENLIPKRFSVGTGMLIDRHGNYSKQMDIVIYDSGDEPGMLAQTNQVLFPVENVRLCIEVKTTLDNREIIDVRAKKLSIEELDSSTGIKPPLALFAYRSSVKATVVSSALAEAQTSDGPRPDFACVVMLALMAAVKGDEWQAGVAPLRCSDASGDDIVGVYERPTADESTATRVIRAQKFYPLVDVGSWLVGEPSRALLLFCEQVLQALTAGIPLVFSQYIPESSREVSPCG